MGLGHHAIPRRIPHGKLTFKLSSCCQTDCLNLNYNISKWERRLDQLLTKGEDPKSRYWGWTLNARIWERNPIWQLNPGEEKGGTTFLQFPSLSRTRRRFRARPSKQWVQNLAPLHLHHVVVWPDRFIMESLLASGPCTASFCGSRWYDLESGQQWRSRFKTIYNWTARSR